MASKDLRGNYLGMVPSTCRKPICLWLSEVLSYSCTPAAPAQDQAHGGLEPPPWGRVLLLRAAAPIADALQGKSNLNFCPGVW